MSWNQRLTIARTNAQIKKSDFAKRVGVSAATVTDWEAGDIKKLDAEKMIRICQILGVSAEWLVTGRELKTINPYHALDVETIHVVQVMQNMTEYQRHLAAQIVDSIAQPMPSSQLIEQIKEVDDFIQESDTAAIDVVNAASPRHKNKSQ
ncbi:helix-turn-helix transcriptional regulator [Undibacterium sp. RTI2.1]|uniref:helix-turn-helix domain-containing protein n=1 Tax=unclassified Undibacterium TaxID=2630295 RepID=UPI002AB56584|nr:MULTISPECIES: helix-turn-helix transcriptional regulator [unclassified Undibacterium]MDY7537660.1 helix-turn-helix transcriptional regulator [Undibacterium sp. 5I1]MEB0029262.1 helix-turn-helix transcriptional regulator [Undibacterium sp. RTI2.1]MEB0115570.1 helix-turn-helix transcriptional regulator [Undibacterium sp. RTI2.2]MEB0256397.1 helix-turn-helix transcriptional regulator [Undibacterium sp. 5I1]